MSADPLSTIPREKGAQYGQGVPRGGLQGNPDEVAQVQRPGPTCEVAGGDVEVFTSPLAPTCKWHLVIPGEPVAKGRPKFTTIGGFARAYTPKKTERYEDTVKYFARREWKTEPLRDVAITARIVAYRSIPTSLSKAKRAAAIAGTLHPISRPDHDNYSKIVCDALNGIVFADDAAITECHTFKRYSEQPRMEIVLTWGAQ